MKPYPVTKSTHSRFAQWTVTHRDGKVTTGGAFLSFTKPRRALWRLIAHLEKEVPTAARYDACFPADDIYCGLEGEPAADLDATDWYEADAREGHRHV